MNCPGGAKECSQRVSAGYSHDTRASPGPKDQSRLVLRPVWGLSRLLRCTQPLRAGLHSFAPGQFIHTFSSGAGRVPPLTRLGTPQGLEDQSEAHLNLPRICGTGGLPETAYGCRTAAKGVIGKLEIGAV